MKNKIWYEIHGEAQYGIVLLLAKVKSKVNAMVVADALAKSGYKNVSIK